MENIFEGIEEMVRKGAGGNIHMMFL